MSWAESRFSLIHGALRACQRQESSLLFEKHMLAKSILPLISLLLVVATSTASSQSFLTNGLVAYYPFNRNANDESGNGNNGVVLGAILAADRLGNPNRAYRFDGTNSVIAIDSLASVKLPEMTVSAWIKPLAVQKSGAAIINKWRAYSYSLEDYALHFQSSLVPNFGNGRHGTGYLALPNHCSLAATNRLEPGKWYQVLATLDAVGTGSLWVNGVLQRTDFLLPLLPPSTEPVRIGQMLRTERPPFNGAVEAAFDGVIDEVRIYRRALIPQEIRQLYVFEATIR